MLLNSIKPINYFYRIDIFKYFDTNHLFVIQIEFTSNAKSYIQKKMKQEVGDNILILDLKQKRASCTITIEPNVYFRKKFKENNSYQIIFNKEKLKILMNSEIIPLLENPQQIIIDFKTGIFKKLFIKNANKKVRLLPSCLIK